VDLPPTFCGEKPLLCVSKDILLYIFLFSISFSFSKALVHPENQLCAFLNYSGVDAVRVIEILCPSGGNFGEYLLVFQTLAIYVDLQGRKSRDREIMYPAFPTYISKSKQNFGSIHSVQFFCV